MGRLIDSDVLREEVYSWGMNDYEPSDFTDAIDDAPTVEAIPIPQDATNEDILKAVFPKDADDLIKYIKAAILNGWLNSKYGRNEDGNDDN